MNNVAETASGKVSGTVAEDVVAFKTIPYAASTAGANRFLPPRPPAPWAGIRDCSDFTGKAPQMACVPPPAPNWRIFPAPPIPRPKPRTA